MRRLFYILAATLIALLSWPLVPAQAGAEERGGIEGAQTKYPQMVGGTNQGIDGSPGFIWPPGGRCALHLSRRLDRRWQHRNDAQGLGWHPDRRPPGRNPAPLRPRLRLR